MDGATPSQRLALVSLVVDDYDEAIAFFTTALRFRLVEDMPMGSGKRWVVVEPRRASGMPEGASLLLAKATTPQQRSHVGNQTGGRVFLFLHTTDFWTDYRRMQAHGVHFMEAPRVEPYGQVVVFLDLCGNRWDLVQMRSS